MKIKVNGMEVAEVDLKDLKPPNITYNISYEVVTSGLQYIGEEPLPDNDSRKEVIKLENLINHIQEETGFEKEWIEIIVKSASIYLQTHKII